MKTFDGRVCVVTGAGSGIGRSLAAALASRGARLALSDVDTAGLDETVQQCAAHGAKVNGYVVDVADRDAVFAHADQVAADLGPAELVVNNAGVALSASLAETTYDDFDWLMGINFWGVVHGTQAFLPQLSAGSDTHLVNISSLFGLLGMPKQAAYCSAKFAVRGFTESVRQELKLQRSPVAVSCVHPGGIKTAIARNARVGASEDATRTAGLFDKVAFTSSDSAAAAILRGVRRGRGRILVGLDAKALDLLPRALGSGYQVLNTAGVQRLDY